MKSYGFGVNPLFDFLDVEFRAKTARIQALSAPEKGSRVFIFSINRALAQLSRLTSCTHEVCKSSVSPGSEN
jgi:hypothetical protein